MLLPIPALLYLLGLLGVFVGMYVVLAHVFSRFFHNAPPRLTRRAIRSILLVLVCIAAGYALSFVIPSAFWANRVLHAIAGGVAAVLLCFCVLRDLSITPSRFQFFILTFCIVMTLGVANELAELALYTYVSDAFTPGRIDTWFDLLSNVIGAGSALAVLTPLVRRS